MAETRPRFDPYGVLQALDRQRVKYVVIGGFARVLQGTEEITRGIDIVPSTRGDNLNRLDKALQEIHAKPAGGTGARAARVEHARTARARARDRLRRVEGRSRHRSGRGATTTCAGPPSREPLGRGVRPEVASIGDLARMSTALGTNATSRT